MSLSQNTTSLRIMSGMVDLFNEGAPASGAYETCWATGLEQFM